MSDTSDTITQLNEAVDLLIDERDAYHDELEKLKQENNQLREQVFELTKDQIRLDWLQSSDITLHHWDEGGIWCKSMIYTIRECIDREMEDEMKELK
jgi:hypothetical protein